MTDTLNDAQRRSAVLDLHRLAAAHRTQAARLRRPGGYQAWVDTAGLGIVVPSPVVDELTRAFVAQLEDLAAGCDRRISELLAHPSDAARHRLTPGATP